MLGKTTLITLIFLLAETAASYAQSSRGNNFLELVGERHFGATGVGDYVLLPEDNVFLAGFLGGRVRSLGFFPAGEEATNDLHTNVGSISQMVYSHKERLLTVLGQSEAIELWNVAKRTKVGELRGPRKHYFSLALSPDERLLAAGTGEYPKWGEISLWDLTGQKLLKTIQDQKDLGGIGHLAFVPDGKSLISASVGGAILVDVNTGTPVAKFATGNKEVVTVAISNKQLALAVAGPSENGDGEIWIFDLLSRRRLAVMTGVSKAVNRLKFSTDGKFLAAGAGFVDNDGHLYLWNALTKEKLFADQIHFDRILGVQFTRDSRSLISADGSGFVKFWRIKRK